MSNTNPTSTSSTICPTCGTVVFPAQQGEHECPTCTDCGKAVVGGSIDGLRCDLCYDIVVEAEYAERDRAEQEDARTGTSPEDCANCGDPTDPCAICEDCYAESLTGHPDYPLSDWQYEVANDDTRLSYTEWVDQQEEADLAQQRLDAYGPTAEALAEWDRDRLLFYVGELEAQVQRLSKPEPEDTVTLTLTIAVADAVVWALANAIDATGGYAERVLTEAHDEIVGALPKEDEAP